MAARRITFGAFVPQGWKTELAGIGGAEAKWATLVEVAETIERLGYDSLWTEPDTTYKGKHFTLDGAQCDPKPLQAPHPPILIGGSGEQLTLRVVARLADRSNFGGTPEEFANKCDVLRRHRDAVGRDYDEIEKTWTPSILVRETEDDVRAAAGSHVNGEPFERWRAGNLVGTPQQVVVDKIGAYVELGVTGFLPWHHDLPATEGVHIVAEQVVPAFR